MQDAAETLEEDVSETDVQQEYNRQRQFLERSISALKAKVRLPR